MLPSPNTVPIGTVLYYSGDFYYCDGITWLAVVTAGAFTSVQAENLPNTLTLGQWTALIINYSSIVSSQQNQISTLMTQVASQNTSIQTLTTQVQNLKSLFLSVLNQLPNQVSQNIQQKIEAMNQNL